MTTAVPDVAEREEELSRDEFLGGALKIWQPRRGFRAGSDAVLLGAAIEAKAGESLLDVGAGVGTAGYCALHRLAGTALWSIEIQSELASLARQNAEQNGFADRCHILEANIGARQSFAGLVGPGGKPLLEAGFDHVFTNPPFFERDSSQAAGTEARTLARREADVPLADWLRFSIARARSKGTVTVIHRAERLGEILAVMEARCGRLRVIPLWADEKSPAKRIIVQGVKGAKSPLRLMRGLVLHGADGRPSEASEAIHRNSASLARYLD
ncbi:MAG: methyltransferase [Sneathiella sp.]|jgi:tRNA1(Val) A37 N6-methylase TrmN6|uniref:tRNA1(Val) (adenine(37)-N6)-methyltransferase n=1 Tax=Sneathiella sp. TaxID=1964365 RepID=UPI000C4D5673|nr:methyltransferase [Sneathiella sp.]MAL78137.1 methyltransferase [Sneathiella sp.]